MSFLTCFWLFPQNEHLSRSPPSPMRATCRSSLVAEGGRENGRPAPDVISPRFASSSFNAGVGALPSPFRRQRTRSCTSTAPDARGARGRRGSDRRRRLAADEDLVDQAVLLGLVGGEDLVALDVGANLLDAAAAVQGERVLEPAPHPQDLVGLDLDVARLPVVTAGHGRLVDQDAGVGQRVALAG